MDAKKQLVDRITNAVCSRIPFWGLDSQNKLRMEVAEIVQLFAELVAEILTERKTK